MGLSVSTDDGLDKLEYIFVFSLLSPLVPRGNTLIDVAGPRFESYSVNALSILRRRMFRSGVREDDELGVPVTECECLGSIDIDFLFNPPSVSFSTRCRGESLILTLKGF